MPAGAVTGRVWTLHEVSRPDPRRAQLAIAGTLFVLLMGANLPTPLYAGYERQYRFSSALVTVIFATYALVLIPSLLLFGQLSDRVGRRRVLLGGLAVGAAGLAVFAAARGIGWLFAARALQGMAVGASTGTATAALVEVEPEGDNRKAARAAVLGQAGGAALGPLLTGLLAQWAPAPRVLSYLVGLAAIGVVATGMLRIPEPGRPGGRWRLQWPSVPPAIRSPFARDGLTAAAVWAVGALFLSVVPLFAAKLLHTGDLALLGAIAATMLAVACGSQMLSLRLDLPTGRAQPLGLVLLAAGLTGLALAVPTHALWLVLAGAVLAGAGLGVGFYGSQTEINALAPADRRGEVTAAFITCIYLGVAGSAIGAGLLSDAFSLSVAVLAAAVLIGGTALATASWHLAASRR